MLRITRVADGGARASLKLEGKLMGAWVEALREAALLEGSSGLGLDLAAVTFVDATGMQLLHELLTAGAWVVSCRGLVAELLQREVS